MKEYRVITILSMVPSLSDDIKKQLLELGVNLVTKENLQDLKNITHIAVESIDQAKTIASDYKTLENDIQIICFGENKNIRDLLAINGRSCLNSKVLSSSFSKNILTRFLLKEYTIHLDDEFTNNLKLFKKFSVTNHLNTGVYFDELMLDAFSFNQNVVSMRSYLDHVLFYFTYLKQAGLAGVPFEFEYGGNDDFFSVNIHLPVKNFVAEYMIDSFGEVNPNDPLKYLLASAYRSTNFLEITLIEDPARLVFTAYWSKDLKGSVGLTFNNIHTSSQMLVNLESKIRKFELEEDIESENNKAKEEFKVKSLPGSILEMVIDNDDESSALNDDPEKTAEIMGFVIGKIEDSGTPISEIDENTIINVLGGYEDQEFAQKILGEKEKLLDNIQKKNVKDAYEEELERVRDNLKEDDDFKQTLKSSLSEEVVKRVKGHLDAEKINKILSGDELDSPFKQTVSGSPEEADDFKQTIGGYDEKNKGEFVARFSSSFEKKKGEFNVKISNSSLDDPKKKKSLFQEMISSAVDDFSSFDDIDLNVRKYFKKNAPKKIELHLDKYAESIGKRLADLSLDELEDFKQNEIPKVVGHVIEDQDSISDFAQNLEEGFDFEKQRDFDLKLKQKLEERLEDVDGVEFIDGSYKVTDETLSQDHVEKIIEESMREVVDQTIVFDEASSGEVENKEEEIVKSLSFILDEDEDKVQEIVSGTAEAVKEKELSTVVSQLFKEKPGEKEEKIVVGDKTFEANEDNKKKDANDKTQESVVKQQGKNLAEAELIKKIKKVESEKRALEMKVKQLEVKGKASKEIAEKVRSIDEQVKSTTAEEKKLAKNVKPPGILQPSFADNEEKKIKDQLREKKLQDEEAQRVEQMIEKEKKLIKHASNIEEEYRHFRIETDQKISLLEAELSKGLRVAKGKDLAVSKAKDQLKSIVLRKNEEITNLTRDRDELISKSSSSEVSQLSSEVKKLQKENENFLKTAELYKSKMETMSKQAAHAKKNDDTSKLIAENHQLKTIKTQFENKLRAIEKDSKSLSFRFEKSKELESRAQHEVKTLKKRAEEAEKKFIAIKQNEARLIAMAEKSQRDDATKKQSSSKEVERYKQQIQQLQTKLKATSAKGGSGAGGSKNVKEKQLEQAKKKLTTDLTKAKQEITGFKEEVRKAKSENIKLMNNIKALEKEVARAKSVKPPKKAA